MYEIYKTYNKNSSCQSCKKSFDLHNMIILKDQCGGFFTDCILTNSWIAGSSAYVISTNSKLTNSYVNKVSNSNVADSCVLLPVKNSYIVNSHIYLTDIHLLDNWIIKNSLINYYADLFTWIDDKHIVFKYFDSKFFFKDGVNDTIVTANYRNPNYLSNGDTYIAKIFSWNKTEFDMQIVWNVNMQKQTNHLATILF